MADFLVELFRRYGLWILPVVALLLTMIWGLTHWTAQAGERVSVLWGLVEYTKDRSGKFDNETATRQVDCTEPLHDLTDQNQDLVAKIDQCTADLRTLTTTSGLEQVPGTEVRRDDIQSHLQALTNRDQTLKRYETNFSFKLFYSNSRLAATVAQSIPPFSGKRDALSTLLFRRSYKR